MTDWLQLVVLLCSIWKLERSLEPFLKNCSFKISILNNCMKVKVILSLLCWGRPKLSSSDESKLPPRLKPAMKLPEHQHGWSQWSTVYIFRDWEDAKTRNPSKNPKSNAPKSTPTPSSFETSPLRTSQMPSGEKPDDQARQRLFGHHDVWSTGEASKPTHTVPTVMVVPSNKVDGIMKKKDYSIQLYLYSTKSQKRWFIL